MSLNNTLFDPEEVGRYRTRQWDRPAIPYERIGDSDRVDQKGEAIRILEEGWAFASFPTISVDPPLAWDNFAPEDRSLEFRLHCWDFLGPALCVLDLEADERLLSHVVGVAEDWAQAHPSLDTESRMAWYDMAVGLRAHRLAFIVDLAARSPNVDDSTLGTLLASVRLHQEALAQEGIFKPHSNHGFYVAAGQKAMSVRLAILPDMNQQRTQADERLRAMVTTQFTPEGVHREHSPDYHRMILSTLRHLQVAGLLPADTPVDIEAIEEALAWFVLPDRTLAMFGDTPRRILAAWDSYISPVVQYAATGGRAGSPPDQHYRAFSDSGYVVYRSGWPSDGDDPEEWTYLAFNGAFHSRTHKHADDLSFVWYDRGSHLLVDSGRFGYIDQTTPDSELGRQGFYYAHPSRIYVEETRAHNAVDIDGQSYQRRGVKPYGTAIRRSGEQQGLFFVEAYAKHLTLDRSARIEHTRFLVLSPREWLVVYDRLSDPRNRPHDFRQWFQFAPHLDVEADDVGWSVSGSDSWQLWGIPLLEGTRSEVMRGVTEPQLQGWISYQDNELEPASSVHLATRSTSSVSLATLFCFTDTRPIPLRSSASPHRLDFEWRAKADQHLAVDLPREDPVNINLETTRS